MKAFTLLALLFSLSAHASWERRSFSGMSYWLYSPASAGAANGLMLSLHGCSQKAEDLKQLGNWEAAAEKHHLYVAIPDVPNGGVLLGCWDYYGRDQTETNRDNGPLIGLSETLLADPAFRIDPLRVYASGLSSGASQALLLGCLRPDLFSGVASNSGPAVGSTMNEISRPSITAEEATRFCASLAGPRSAAFARQKAVLLRGDNDYVVGTSHAELNARVFSSLYAATSAPPVDLATYAGSNPAGSATFYRIGASPRVALLINTGLQHNWAAGNQRGGQPSHFVNPYSLDLPEFLASFFEPKL